jgi:uncharacterized membrane protein (UPF0127 family)
VTNVTRGETLATRSNKVDTFLRRGLGLMGKKSLPDGGGLIIEPCNGVVSFFMRFPIDVLFIGREGDVRHVLPSLTPWKMSKVVRGSRFVIELPAGSIARTGTEAGDRITIEPA